jgi:hypothetical protein
MEDQAVSHTRTGLDACHRVIFGSATAHHDQRHLGVTTRCPEGYVPGDECLLRAALYRIQRVSCFSQDSALQDLW